jgi:hypothetical protein
MQRILSVKEGKVKKKALNIFLKKFCTHISVSDASKEKIFSVT